MWGETSEQSWVLWPQPSDEGWHSIHALNKELVYVTHNFKIVSVLVGLFYMILVTLNKHTDHMTSIKCHLLKWSAWKTLVPRGLLSTGHSESCVTGKIIPVHYYHQCPFIKGQQVMAPMTVWRDFLSGSLQIEGFYFKLVCVICWPKEEVWTPVSRNVQC